jgi:hypothetical protein
MKTKSATTIGDTAWDHELNGLDFEEIFFNLLSSVVKKQDGFDDIWKTEKVGDKGVDVIIKITSDIVLFNRKFLHQPRNKSQYSYIFIEIKIRDKNSISASEFANSLLRDKEETIQPSYLILVTDTYVSAESHHRAMSAAISSCYEFVLIDKIILLNFLSIHTKHNIKMPSNIKSEKKISVNQHIEDVIDSNDAVKNTHEQRLYLQIRNNTNEDKNVSIHLKTDLLTDFSGENKRNIHLNPFEIIVRPYKLISKTKITTKIDINIDGDEIVLNGNIKEIQFNPPLFGKRHKALLKQLTEDGKDDTVRIIDITGEGGAGKSKIINSLKPKPAYIKLNDEPRNNNEFLDLVNKLQSNEATIVVDDMHHGSESFFNLLGEVVRKITSDKSYSLKLILVGRNDYSFINTNYEKFINMLRDKKLAKSYTVKKWDVDDCTDFINKIVKNAPKKIIDKIIKTSDCNPFGVIQTIQYLLDKQLAELYDTDIVGITNIENIGAKNGLPDSIRELIEERLKALDYESLIDGLVALNYSTKEFSAEIFNEIFSSNPNYIPSKVKILDTLLQRQFISKTSNDDSNYEFAHENISIYLDSIIEDKELKVNIGKTLLNYYKNRNIEKHKKGYLHFLANEYTCAIHHFEDISHIIESESKNVSSISISIEYLPYIRPLYMSILNVSKHQDRKQIHNLIRTEVHLSTHLTHLRGTLQVIENSLEFMKKNKKHIDDYQKLQLAIIGQKAHVILNLGHVLYAKSILEELIADVTIMGTKDSEIDKILFDAHDRLQNIYHQLNYQKMFNYHSKISEQIAITLKDNQLLSLVESSRIKEFYYQDPKLHLQKTKDATEYSMNNASERHKIHARLNELIASLIVNQTNEAILAIQDDLLKLHAIALRNIYTFSITRSLLAIATTYAMLGLNKEYNLIKCEEYADKTIDSIIDYGNGFFKWQVHNLKAIIEYCKDKNNKKIANGFFMNAISNLAEQGLLNLGNFDLLSINLSVLSNYFLFIQKTYHSERMMYWLFKKINYNGKCFEFEEQEFTNKILKSLKKYQFIGANSRIEYILKEPSTHFYLALR